MVRVLCAKWWLFLPLLAPIRSLKNVRKTAPRTITRFTVGGERGPLQALCDTFTDINPQLGERVPPDSPEDGPTLRNIITVLTH